MEITCLMEDTRGHRKCVPQHGLSFYVETNRHKILMDTGPSAQTLENAKIMGIDLSKIDTIVLSHGHYDHTGGVLPLMSLCPNAKIYIRSKAFAPYYSCEIGKEPRYIGVDPKMDYLKNVISVDRNVKIDSELYLIGDFPQKIPTADGNKLLKVRVGNEYVQDPFNHEQCLLIKQKFHSVLFGGCAHSGIVNIMDRVRELMGRDPDLVVSGFHLNSKDGYFEKDKQLIEQTAQELMKYDSMFYTCHCTGEIPYGIMKNIMEDKLDYVRCGQEIPVGF